ncbi:MAG: hypothetical protein DI537_14615 [Stutzerimonas stutzeri]|nr:MAG: hypothetical protein DI537_14615 [Stutzerimonas stutzeri]
MATYRVTFTTQRIVSTFDPITGAKTGETVEHKPQVVTGLPYSTAVSYKDRDNFEFEVEAVEAQKRLPKPSQPNGFEVQLKKAKKAAKKAVPTKPTRTQTAAEKGDLGAALGNS